MEERDGEAKRSVTDGLDLQDEQNRFAVKVTIRDPAHKEAGWLDGDGKRHPYAVLMNQRDAKRVAERWEGIAVELLPRPGREP